MLVRKEAELPFKFTITFIRARHVELAAHSPSALDTRPWTRARGRSSSTSKCSDDVRYTYIYASCNKIACITDAAAAAYALGWRCSGKEAKGGGMTDGDS